MSEQEQPEQRITRLTVAGYKSISREQSIDIRPLTILAGANSSGKSSMLQPLLLLKQTLEASYDPGTLLLNGPNVKFFALRQMLSYTGKKASNKKLRIGIGFSAQADLTLDLEAQLGKRLMIQRMLITGRDADIELRPDMGHDAILAASSPQLRLALEQSLVALNEMYHVTNQPLPRQPALKVIQRRCFLDIALVASDNAGKEQMLSLLPLSSLVDPVIRQVIYLPGLRGNPERLYPLTASGPTFPGPFQQYVASVIAQWQETDQHEILEQLAHYLKTLALTRRIVAAIRDDSRIELQVDRLPPNRAGEAKMADLVNIADVGVGVSQTLPVLVALLLAAPGQMVYIEQPEIHLHPRAQVAFAQVLADAASRGVHVVVETHSSLLLLAVQALVAEERLSPDIVKLHWFTRDRNGLTNITSADLDEFGAFGDWPEDFANIDFEIQSRYLDAADARQVNH